MSRRASQERSHQAGENERLLSAGPEQSDMDLREANPKSVEAFVETRTDGAQGHSRRDYRRTSQESSQNFAANDSQPQPVGTTYRVYKRRWFGLVQLVFLNIIVSWDWLSYSPVANTAAAYFSTTPSIVNWLSTAFLFAFVTAAPLTLYVLHSHGPRLGIIIASVLLLLGNWIRYAGTRASPPSYPAVMLGQVLCGLSQPFVLASPTRYSDLWFTPAGRVSATAIMSLANPLGGALASLIDPFLAVNPPDIGPMTLYIALIATVITIPGFFIPAKPPTPVGASSTVQRASLRLQLHMLAKNKVFFMVAIPFGVYVGFFNSFSSLLTQILTPYGYSESDAGIAGAVLILVGLVTAAVVSPLIDKYKKYLLLIKILAPTIALGYLAFIWAPPTRSLVAPYIICGALGAASFSLMPVALEWLAEVTWPVGPELSSVISWSAGQLLGGIFIIVSDALESDAGGDPPYNLSKALIFQAVVALAALPCIGALWVMGPRIQTRRLELDKVRSIDSGNTGTTGVYEFEDVTR